MNNNGAEGISKSRSSLFYFFQLDRLILVLISFFYPRYSHGSNDDCSFYVAQSSIPGAGQGLFTTRNINKGDHVGESDLTLSVVDLDIHNGGDYPSWIHFDYFWEAEEPVEFFLGKTVEIGAFPVGSLSNYHTSLHNIRPTTIRYDDQILSRLTDPGAGAFSYHVERNFTASRDIAAGEELFADYGEEWLDDHNLVNVPRKKNFRRVNRIAQEMKKLDRILNPLHEEVIKSIRKIVSWYDKKTAAMLPKTFDDVYEVLSEGAEWKTVEKRTPEWIRENGQCIDHIRPGLSTIRQAGRGAFAKHFLSAGSVVAPMPLLHVFDKSTMNVYELFHNGKTVNIDKDKLVSMQLMLNYCFGHRESSFLLCPASLAALINHKSSRNISQEIDDESDRECIEGPNAEIRWSRWDHTTEDWLKLTFAEMEKRGGRGLAFEIIALRDISPGEEIFIDYGEEWESAWETHEETWKPPADDFESFMSAEKMNEQNFEIRTAEELRSNPYADNIMLTCLYWEFEDEEEKTTEEDWEKEDSEESDDDIVNDEDDDLEDEDLNWRDMNLEDLIYRFGVAADADLDFSQSDGSEYWPCKALAVDRENDLYTVRIFQSPIMPTTVWTEKDIPMILTDMPRYALRFFDKPRKSDPFLPGAFRHPIGIRDDMFPEHWKNLKDEVESS